MKKFLWQMTMHVIPNLNPFRSTSNRFQDNFFKFKNKIVFWSFPNFRPFHYISNRLWDKCKFMFFFNFPRISRNFGYFKIIKKMCCYHWQRMWSQILSLFRNISYRFWDKCQFMGFFKYSENFEILTILKFPKFEKLK